MALNVLIVDDSPMMRNLVGRVLSLSGIEIGCRLDAGNGVEALELLKESPVDLVLVDINMPVMNGEDLVREMSRRENLRTLPVVVISTDGTSRRMERMKELGVCGYLQKPFRPEDLRDEVERVMSMPRIPQDEVDKALEAAATRILETMCFTCVISTQREPLNLEKTPIGSAVRFSGSLSGELELWASQQIAASLAMSFLGSRDESTAAANSRPMLNELANMMCGAALTDVYRDGEFHLDSPAALSREECGVASGLHIESEDGSIWVSLEVGPGRWKANAQSEC